MLLQDAAQRAVVKRHRRDPADDLQRREIVPQGAVEALSLRVSRPSGPLMIGNSRSTAMNAPSSDPTVASAM